MNFAANLNNCMMPSINAFNLIKKWEGFRAQPYKCPAGVWTIGYGSTFYINGSKVSKKDPSITETMASTIMQNVATDMGYKIYSLLDVKITQNQFDALVDFCYNLGVNAFKNSTMLKLINMGEINKAGFEFSKWIHANGKVLSGLVLRRKDEFTLYTQK